ncbi:N-acetylglucosamine-6-phosphate deacetylase [Saccharopolyspora shandongensis]|uniref:N-acetylglucosamine-6-phosphate deacetylase n=1 Tax=Saccharopolyspora shandongensis TaxID=418495 RepID=UPI0033E436BA
MILGGGKVVAADSTVLDPGWVEVRDGRIASTGAGRAPQPVDVDLRNRWLVPGFVDMHVHGGGGAAFQDGTGERVRRAVEFHRSHGTTTLVAGLVTAPLRVMERKVAELAESVQDGLIAGVHLEGPFLAAAHCGAHPPSLLRAPAAADLRRLLDAGAGAVRMVTLAPELPGGLDAVRQVVDSGATAAIGHTDADYELTRAAVDAGVTVATHLWNGMRPQHHRRPGPVPALLEAAGVTIELIVDGLHLHPAIAHAAARAAGPGRTALVTDAIAAAGLGDGTYTLGEATVRVRGGEARLAEGDSLAGSTLTLDRALRNAVAIGIPFLDALAAITSVPARAVGLGGEAGSLAPGRPADLVVLTADLAVDAVFARGNPVINHTEER